MKLQNSQVNMRGHVNSARSLAPAFSAGCFLSVCVAVSQRKEGPAHCIDFYASISMHPLFSGAAAKARYKNGPSSWHARYGPHS